MKNFLKIACVFALTACSSPNKIPDDIISIDKMKLIFWDMTRAGKLAQEKYRKDSAHMKVIATEAFQQVFDLYHVTKEDFYRSYKYYEEHPDKNKILMDSVSAYASRQRQELYQHRR